MRSNFKQKQLKPGTQTGSFINMMMSSNSSMPEVGKGATILLWSDRHAYEVTEVSKDKKRVIIQQYHPERIDKNGMSESQEYKYERLSSVKEVIVWKWGAWRKEIESIVFIDENFTPTPKDHDECKYWDKETGSVKLINGVTKKVKEYHKINIIWGVKQEYYDFTF